MIGGINVRLSPWVPHGVVHYDPTHVIYARNIHQFMLLMFDITWHPEGDRCPTWTNRECRCMLGDEA